ncbi:MAG: hypothetical protein WEB88_15185 [Gemmatimonadota bacterium]
MRQPLLTFTACISVALAAACSSDDPSHAESAGVAIRDSAGIRIVENPEHAPDRTGWSIDTVPILAIGGDESLGEAYLFGRVMDVLRLGDGGLVVADGQLDAVRMYGPDGTYLRQAGRRGQGPGEYTGVSELLHLPGDGFAVRSGYGGRALVHFDSAGEHVGSTAPPSLPDDGGGAGFGVLTFVDAFGDGTFLARVTSNPTIGARGETPGVITLAEGVQRLARVGTDGHVGLEYGAFPGARHMCISMAERLCGVRNAGLYLPQPHIATAGGRLYFADGARFEIIVYGADGRIERIIRKPATPRTIAAAWGDSLHGAMADFLARFPVGSRIARDLPAIAVPEHAPPIDALHTDPAGNLWVRSGGPGNPAPPTWFVFDSTGVLTHSLESRVEPLRIGADYVLTTARDEYGVERVEVLRLRKR